MAHASYRAACVTNVGIGQIRREGGTLGIRCLATLDALPGFIPVREQKKGCGY